MSFGGASERTSLSASRALFVPAEEEWMMKGLLIVLVLLAVTVVGLGFYLGWFHVSTGGTDGNSSATITVDKDKIKSDEEKATEKAKDLKEKATEKAKDKTGATTEKGKEEPPKP
jgi:hypothetical protein